MAQAITKTTTCCFFGHREIEETEDLKKKLYLAVENHILNEGVDTFLFGSKSRFNRLCHEVVTILKEKYPHIKRIYVRAEFPYISEDYKAYLLESYEDTYYPQEAVEAGRAVYVKRNHHMIDKSCFCIVYYQENRLPQNRKSGTELALRYARRKNRKIIILP